MVKLTGPLASIPGLCYANPSEATIDRIKQNLPSDVDQWEKWLDCIQINGIEPLVQSSLVQMKIEIPRWVSMTLEDRSNMIRLRNRLRRESFNTLLRRLSEENVPVIVLDGDSIAQEIYHDYDYRRFFEVNLLIQPHLLPTLRQIMADCGYLPLLPNAKLTDSFLIPGFRLPLFINRLLTLFVNTQTSLFPPLRKNRLTLDSIWGRAKSFSFQKVELKRLSQEDFILHLCSKYASYKLGLRELADIYNCLASWRDFNWRTFKYLAEEAQLINEVYRVLALCHSIYYLESIQEFLALIQNEVNPSIINEVEIKSERPDLILIHRSSLIGKIEKTFALYTWTENPLEKGYLAARIFKYIFLPPSDERSYFFNVPFNTLWLNQVLAPILSPFKVLSALSTIYGRQNLFKNLLLIPIETSTSWLKFLFRFPTRGLRQKAEQNGISLQELGPLLSN